WIGRISPGESQWVAINPNIIQSFNLRSDAELRSRSAAKIARPLVLCAECATRIIENRRGRNNGCRQLLNRPQPDIVIVLSNGLIVDIDFRGGLDRAFSIDCRDLNTSALRVLGIGLYRDLNDVQILNYALTEYDADRFAQIAAVAARLIDGFAVLAKWQTVVLLDDVKTQIRSIENRRRRTEPSAASPWARS